MLTAEDKAWIRGILEVYFQEPAPPVDTEQLGEIYDSAKIVNLFLENQDIDTDGKWWRRAVADLPTHILYDDIDKAETDQEMAILEVNEEWLKNLWRNTTDFLMRTVIVYPARDIDGSEIKRLACLPNINMLDGVGQEYAHRQLDKVVRGKLSRAKYADEAIAREAERLARLSG